MESGLGLGFGLDRMVGSFLELGMLSLADDGSELPEETERIALLLLLLSSRGIWLDGSTANGSSILLSTQHKRVMVVSR